LVVLRIRPTRPILLGVLLTIPLGLSPLLPSLRAPLLVMAAITVPVGVVCAVFLSEVGGRPLRRRVLQLAGPLAAGVGPRPALVAAAGTVVVPSLLALAAPGVRRAPGRPAPTDRPAATHLPELARAT
jgi:hypothetical protein